MRRPVRQTRGRGFSIIEMLVAVAVFTVFYFVVLEVWPLNAQAARQSRNVASATHLAQREMEYAIYQGYDSAASRSGTFTVSHTVNGRPHSTDFTYDVQVTQTSASLKDVVVSVDWTDPGAAGRAVQRRIQMETVLGDT